MKRIGIIGGGFAGTMTAVQLIQNSIEKIEICIICDEDNFNRGIAYNSYSNRHILNVITSKMSAFPDLPSDFLDWVAAKDEFKIIDKNILSLSFLSRNLYGEYLVDIWNNAEVLAKSKNISLVVIKDRVIDVQSDLNHVQFLFEQSKPLGVDICVIATGNQVPKNPNIQNTAFYTSPNYFQNPWKIDTIQNIKSESPILIVGNGLTMVDTILGLLEQNFKGEIYSISPNGFTMLPHRHIGMSYTKHLEEINENSSLSEIVSIVNKHIKTVRRFGVSAEPIIDALRPLTQKIWIRLSDQEKSKFLSRLRHLFGVARHRIPLHIYDQIQKLRINGRLHINSGKLLNIEENNGEISVEYFDKKDKKTKSIQVQRVINCTGPESDLSKLDDDFLSKSIREGLLSQDKLKLGLRVNTQSLKTINSKGLENDQIYTLGSNLRGELWETTAVNELRQQSLQLAKSILANI